MRMMSSESGSGTAAEESLIVMAPPNNCIKFAALPCSTPPFWPMSCTEDAANGKLHWAMYLSSGLKPNVSSVVECRSSPPRCNADLAIVRSP